MKKHVAAFVLTALAVLATGTDSGAHPKWQAGLKAGASTTQLTGDQAGLWLSGPSFQVSGTLLDNKVGFIGGPYGRLQLGPKFALQLDALWSRKGGKGNVYGTAVIQDPSNVNYNADINGELSADLDYLELPLLAMLSLPAADGVSFGPYVGLSTGFLVQANTRIQGSAEVPLPDGSTRTQNFDQAYDIKKNVSDYESQMILGATVEWDTSKGRFILDGRYSFSLRTIDGSGDKTIHNSVLSLMAGFAWSKGEEVE